MTWNQFWNDKKPPPYTDVCAWAFLCAVYFAVWWVLALYGLLIAGYVIVYGRAALRAKLKRLRDENEADKRAREYARKRMRHYGMLKDADDHEEKATA